jgi:DNA-binding MarR family transcriptional regulator
VRELAEAAGVSAPTATRMLATLERDELVVRRACAGDRRVVHVALTADGERRVTGKRARIAARRTEIFESLAPAERRQAARMLERLAAAIEELR